jgi:serine protease Do
MQSSFLLILTVILSQWVASAQDDIPLLRPEERQVVDAQTAEFNQSLMPALSDAAKSTVRVWGGKRRLAYGTVVGDGHQILTKWSEVARAAANLRVETSGGVVLDAVISGVYQDDDLAVLAVRGQALVPVRWSKESPRLGAFLAASQPDGRPAAFGVVSVAERNLRVSDQAYLGLVGSLDFAGPGVKIHEVEAQSGAAAAGLKPGDIILQVDQRSVSGVLELKNALVGRQPGSKVNLIVRVEGGEKPLEVLLGNRPQLPNFPGDRLQQMERMGGPLSRVRDAFPMAIQSDMRPKPDQIGGPVVDLKGRVVGITLARADRTRSFIMPAAAVQSVLKTDPKDPALVHERAIAEAPAMTARESAEQGRGLQQRQDRLRRHTAEMKRLLDYMRQEMEGLNP